MVSTTESSAVRRAKKDWQELAELSEHGVTGAPEVGNPFAGTVLLVPAQGSLYHGARLELAVELPARYPLTPPKAVFRTPVYHPNVSTSGEVGLPLLSKDWSPAESLRTVVLSILALLGDPDVNDPVRADAAELYRTDYEAYTARVRQVALG
ncbi:ubiquitin-conjugating enzyme family protein [Streptomyces vinaceus]|uniref:ubiquitin-conjugating enzyme family protein n=1 Tax=Streptomyces vinaceus TaxID=1960 RepID=UPI00382AB40D